ncbi:hypothetical protein BRARA_C03164 [Brassica rapa]|uniref:MADS-box domain-containing protein n=1 Tax=Brassica campestris TaxID=3711 RepID=A0A398A7D7_BRACM|nr:agamous-like MADS-box protein AGL29 [Brassica rapa]XP_013735893.1 agamous-like MADS-box protein AGL29 [Brassica napus]RID71213.1 hypothetical protein BRARA_C03164 [Brassica rapa]VDC81440.1 unnamed protein product [Brassica rapa]
MGRRKIKMEKVQDTNTKQVTFSKRRLGLFKKAGELATLCNAEVGIMVFSPGNKPYPYGSPSFELVAERYNNESEDSDSCETSGNGRGNRARQEKRICKRLNSIMEQVEAEKKRGEDFEHQLETAGGEERFDKPIEELSLEELEEYEGKMMDMLDNIQGNISGMEVSSTLVIMSKDTQNK